MQKDTVICFAVIVLCIAGAVAIWSLPAAGGTVGRASGSRPAGAPVDPSCCLIPANKGLHR